MAEINQEILKRTLVINVEDGTGADGTTKYKAKNFNGIKTDAALDKVYEAGTALGGLMEKPYKDIELSEKSELVDVYKRQLSDNCDNVKNSVKIL